jgi:phytoene/squalene synthetase
MSGDPAHKHLIQRVRQTLDAAGASAQAVDTSMQQAIIALADLATVLLARVDELRTDIADLRKIVETHRNGGDE